MSSESTPESTATDPSGLGLIGFWDFRAGAENKDTGLADGIAQDGSFYGDAYASGGSLQLDGDKDFFKVGGDTSAFDLTEGTIEVQFVQEEHVGGSPDTLVSRGEYYKDDSDGYFSISVTDDGRVQVVHMANGKEAILQTAPGTFEPGQEVTVSYSWDSATGGSLSVQNATLGTSTEVTHDVAGLDMAVGDYDSDSFVFGAREKDDDHYDKFFNGDINYVAFYDSANPAKLDGIVEGTEGDDVIDTAYLGDPDGDLIDAGDAILPGEGPQDDIVKAGAGNDTVVAGEGSDEIYGEDGNDTLYGDGLTSTPPVTVRESFEWDQAPDPDDYGASTVDNNDKITGFTQNTGSVDVTFSVLHADKYVANTFETTTQNVAGIKSDGNPVDDNSSFESVTNGEGKSGDYALEFSKPVDNVSFRINDIDGDGIVKVTAYDASGTPITVNLTAGSKVTLSDTDGVAGNDTADSNGGYEADNSANYSVLVDIPGPVAKIVIEHDQDGSNNSGVNVTDVYFDVVDSADDFIDGGAGDDTLIGGAGADVLLGGDGQDTFEIGAGGLGGDMIGDKIDGGAGGVDHDVLDLRGTVTPGGSLSVTLTGADSNGNGNDGYVTYYDDKGDEIGRTEFEEIEEIVPCFTPGTTIATPKGERRVEDLRVGDKVITRDNGIQEIRWLGAKQLNWQQLNASSHLKPIMIKAGALGNGLPERDMLVSPNHRVLVANDKTAIYFEEREVLAAAKHLVGTEGIQNVDTLGTTYIHFMFDHHEVVLSNGAWTESFQPGDYTLNGLGNAQRSEIFELFPELQSHQGIEDYTAARKTLKKHEARLLVAL